MDIKRNFCTETAKKIFGNKDNAVTFLLDLEREKSINIPFRAITKGKNKGTQVINLNTKEIWQNIVKHWDIEIAISIIRKMFRESIKYQSGIDSHKTMQVLLKEWEKLELGNVLWPFSQGDFDGFVQRINSNKNTCGDIKDNKVKTAAVKYRRIKEINTVRNDFIETLIFNRNECILPTLNHRRGVDFFYRWDFF